MGAIADAPDTRGPLLEWGSATIPLGNGHDSAVSGDLHVVVQLPHGVLLAVIDGLGHGPEAAHAAKETARILEEHAGGALTDVFEMCHNGIRKTRGVVMALASFDARTESMTWAAVGNVEGVLLRAHPSASVARETIPVRGGVVGYQLPKVKEAIHSVSAGDLLVLATDGIRSGFASGVLTDQRPQEMADSLMDRYRKGTDDALVVVARYRGATR